MHKEAVASIGKHPSNQRTSYTTEIAYKCFTRFGNYFLSWNAIIWSRTVSNCIKDCLIPTIENNSSWNEKTTSNLQEHDHAK